MPTVKEPQSIEEYKKDLQNKIDNLYKSKVNTLFDETNIANRYDLKIQIDTIADLYKLLFGGTATK